MPEKVVNRRGPPRLDPTESGRSGLVAIRVAKGQRAKMEDAAERAAFNLSEFIRRSALWCTTPERLNALMADHSHREDTNDPQMKAYRDELRRKYPRRRK